MSGPLTLFNLYPFIIVIIITTTIIAGGTDQNFAFSSFPGQAVIASVHSVC